MARTNTASDHRQPYSAGPRELAALFAVSAALLAYEVWLTRLIALQHWHHLAPLVIAVALLGFGAAAVLVSLHGASVARGRRWLLLPAALLAPAMLLGASLAGALPLNMLALPWEGHQLLLLTGYALCFVPAFFCGALFIAVCFARWPQAAGRIYSADLLGGACGALAALPLIASLGLAPALLLLALLPLVAATVLAAGGRGLRLCALAAVLSAAQYPLLAVQPGEYKALTLRQLERDSQLLQQRDSLSARHSVLAAPGLHAAPGLSLNSRERAPQQWQWFRDGDRPVPLLLPPLPARDYFQQLLGHAPYTLLELAGAGNAAPQVLLLDDSALWAAWTAAAAGAGDIRLTLADGDARELLRELSRELGEGIYPQQLQLEAASARRYLQGSAGDFALIVAEIQHSEAGMAAAQEDHLLTVEGLGAALERLNHGGLLALTVELHALPRDALKAAAMLAAALRERGLPPARHTLALRDWHSALLLASNQPLTVASLAPLQQWAARWHFDLVAPRALAGSERHHWRQGNLDSALQDILAGDEADSLFDIRPNRDDRPFFHHFFRWQSLPALLRGEASWRLQLEWGYLLPLAALAAGTLLSAALLALPLALAGGARPPRPLPLLGYIGGLGLGFMLLEIALLQQSTLLLDASAISLAAVLAAMLAGAGVGSWCQQRWPPRTGRLRLLMLLIALGALLILPLLRGLFTVAAAWPLPARLAVVIAPAFLLSLPMGLPLPHALQCLGAHSRAAVAWAWAGNGFASVLGSLAASLLAMHAGFTALTAAAAGCYLLAAALLPTLPSAADST